MTEDQLRQFQKLLDEIVHNTSLLEKMLREVKDPGSQHPSPFSGGGPADR